MKHDYEVMRDVLLKVEDMGSNHYYLSDNEQEAYEIRLLLDRGCVEGKPYHSLAGDAMVRRLTWQGVQLLDAMRDESIWQRVRDKIDSSGLSHVVSLALPEVIKRIAP